MTTLERFQDNPNGVISDTLNNKDWLPKDSYGDLGEWRDWNEARQYVQLMKQVYAGGFSDWRLPTKEEALSLYDSNQENLDWNNDPVNIHPVFVKNCSRFLWTVDENEAGQALRINLRDGSTDYVDKSLREGQAARLVRDRK